MEPFTVVRVIKDFLTTTEGELSVTKGSTLQVLSIVDRHWVKCLFLEGRVGNVPSAHVTQHINIPKQLTSDQKLFWAINDFKAEEDGDLGLKRGDLILGLKPLDSAWYNGKILSSAFSENSVGKCGIFPCNFCFQLDDGFYRPNGVSKMLSSVFCDINDRNGSSIKFGKVLHSMNAQLPGEMDLTQGEIVKITHTIDQDWFRYNVLPSNEVKFVII